MSTLISLGIGSPSGVTPLLLWGLILRRPLIIGRTTAESLMPQRTASSLMPRRTVQVWHGDEDEP